MNPDGVVEIGENIIRINLVKEKVYVLNKKHIGSYNDLLAENVSNKKILVFSTDQEVLTELKQVQNGRTDLLCFKESGASGNDGPYIRTIDCGGFRGAGFIKYQKYGVYFSLVVEMTQEMYTISSGFVEGGRPAFNWLEFEYSGSYKPKCKGVVNVGLTNVKNGDSQDSNKKVRIYESAVTALNTYNINGRFRYNGCNPSLPWSPWYNVKR